MKNIIGIILLIAGIAIFVQGYNRKDSLAGATDKIGNSIANSVDGGARTSKHVVMMVAGGALALVGIGTIANRRRV